MKKLLFTAFMVVFAGVNLSIAQYNIENLKFKYGEEITDEKGKLVQIVGESNNKIYGLGVNKSKNFLKIFSSGEMKLLSNAEIILPEIKDKDLEFEELALVGGKLYVIGSVYHNKTKTFTLAAIEISESGKLGSNLITLFEAVVAKRSARGGFYYRKSSDEERLMVLHASMFEKEDAMKYEVKIFDPAMATVFSYSEKVGYDDSKKDFQFLLADFDLNNNDDAFIVINESYRDKKAKEKVEKFELLAFKAANGYKKEVIKINFKDKEIINCSMLAVKNNVIQLTGFYSSVRENGKANKELKGIFNATVDLNTNTNTNLKFNEFDHATKVKLLGERRANKGKDLKPLYQIQSIIEREDGGLIVLSEMRYSYQGGSSGIGPLQMTSYVFVSNEIIVTSLKPDGSLDWCNVVAKEQTAAVSTISINVFAGGSNGSFAVGAGFGFPVAMLGKGPEYLGAIPVYENGQLSIIFNDNKKNKGITDIEEIKPLGNYNNAVPTLFQFDNSGKITRKDPEEVIKNELVIRPGVFYRKNNKEYLIYSSRKSQDKLGRMTL